MICIWNTELKHKRRMYMNVMNKKIVVTGGGNGVGRAYFSF